MLYRTFGTFWSKVHGQNNVCKVSSLCVCTTSSSHHTSTTMRDSFVSAWFSQALATAVQNSKWALKCWHWGKIAGNCSLGEIWNSSGFSTYNIFYGKTMDLYFFKMNPPHVDSFKSCFLLLYWQSENSSSSNNNDFYIFVHHPRNIRNFWKDFEISSPGKDYKKYELVTSMR